MNKGLLDAYAGTLETYKDSLAVWKSQIDSSQHAWLSGRTLADAEIARIATKYKLTLSDVYAPYSGDTVQVIPANSVQRIWEIAATDSKKAVSLYLHGTDTPPKQSFHP